MNPRQVSTQASGRVHSCPWWGEGWELSPKVPGGAVEVLVQGASPWLGAGLSCPDSAHSCESGPGLSMLSLIPGPVVKGSDPPVLRASPLLAGTPQLPFVRLIVALGDQPSLSLSGCTWPSGPTACWEPLSRRASLSSEHPFSGHHFRAEGHQWTDRLRQPRQVRLQAGKGSPCLGPFLCPAHFCSVWVIGMCRAGRWHCPKWENGSLSQQLGLGWTRNQLRRMCHTPVVHWLTSSLGWEWWGDP